jgi:hypothetical protein
MGREEDQFVGEDGSPYYGCELEDVNIKLYARHV